MKLLFVDESDGFSKQLRTHFVLAGAIVDAKELFALEAAIVTFRKKFLAGRSLKSLREYNQKVFDHVKKLELTKELCKCIDNLSISFIASISGSRSSNNEKRESYIGCLSFLIERFFFYLVENDDCGIVVLDTLATGHQSYIREHLQQIISRGRKREGRYRDRIFQNVFFGDDEHVNAIQLADLLCATINAAMQRYLESNKGGAESNAKGNAEGNNAEWNGAEASLPGNEDILVCYNSFLPLFWSRFRRFNGSVAGGGIKFWK